MFLIIPHIFFGPPVERVYIAEIMFYLYNTNRPVTYVLGIAPKDMGSDKRYSLVIAVRGSLDHISEKKRIIQEANHMANLQQLHLLKRGTNVWNTWRKSHPTVQIDLSRADLGRADLEGTFLSGINLSGAYLFGAKLRSAYLRGAKLSGACLIYAKLNKADLTDATFDGAILDGADLSEATVSQDQLERAKSLKGTIMPGGERHG
jgi:hypothetical protein